MKRACSGLVVVLYGSETGTAQEVADLVAYLASERSAYMTGQVLTISGGL